MSGAAGSGDSKEEKEQRELSALEMNQEPDEGTRKRRQMDEDARLAGAIDQEQRDEALKRRRIESQTPHSGAAAASSSASSSAPVRVPPPPSDAAIPIRGNANGSSLIPAGLGLEEEKRDPADQEWLDHVLAYPSDRAAAAMYAGLQSDYGFLTHALSDLKHRLHTILSKPTAEGGLGWKHFSLMARGSVITQTALQGGADLDVDLIVPRELPFWRIEGIADFAKSDAGCIQLWTMFRPKIKALWNAIVKPSPPGSASALAPATASSTGLIPKVRLP